MRRRAKVLHTIVARIVRARDASVTIDSLQALLRVPAEAAARIVVRLVASGVLVPLSSGVWVRGPWGPRIG